MTLTTPGTSRRISAASALEDVERQPRRRRRSRIDAVPAAHLDLLAELAPAAAHAGHPVLVQDGQVLERARPGERPFDDGRGAAYRPDPLGRRLANDPRRECRSRKRHAAKDGRRQPERPADYPDGILAKLDERLEDAIAEGVLRVDAELLEHVVLPLDPGHGLVDVGQDRALQQELRFALAHEAPEHMPVERLGDRLAFLLRVGDPRQRGKELRPGVHDLDRHAEVPEARDNPFRFPLAHEAVLDEDRPQPPGQGTMAEHGHGGRVDASGQRVDGGAAADRFLDLPDLLLDKTSRVELLRCNLGDHVAIHPFQVTAPLPCASPRRREELRAPPRRPPAPARRDRRQHRPSRGDRPRP